MAIDSQFLQVSIGNERLCRQLKRNLSSLLWLGVFSVYASLAEAQIAWVDLSSVPASAVDDAGNTTPPSEAESLDKLRQELEERFKKLEEESQQRAKEGDAAEKAAEEEALSKPTFETGGRIHLDYWGFPSNEPGIGFLEHPNPLTPDFGNDPEDRISFRRIRLELEGTLPESMLWRMQVDFNKPAEPEYKDVYFGWQELPGNHTLLMGNQKRPLGLDHINSSRFNVFAERPLVVEAFNEDARRLGICLYGSKDDEAVSWQYGLYNLQNTSTLGQYLGDSLQLGGYGRLVASPWYTDDGRCYSHWAIAGAIARPDGDVAAADTNRNEGRFRTRPEGRSDNRWLDTGPIVGATWYEILAAESMLNIGPWQFTGEYMANFLQRDEVLALGPAASRPNVFFQGFYVYASYFLTGEHMVYQRTHGALGRVIPHRSFSLADRLRGKRSTGGWGAWQIAARYSMLDLTDEDIEGGVGQNVTLGLNWHWTAYSKLQSSFVLGDIREHRSITAVDGRTFRGGDFTIWGMRLMCDF